MVATSRRRRSAAFVLPHVLPPPRLVVVIAAVVFVVVVGGGVGGVGVGVARAQINPVERALAARETAAGVRTRRVSFYLQPGQSQCVEQAVELRDDTPVRAKIDVRVFVARGGKRDVRIAVRDGTHRTHWSGLLVFNNVGEPMSVPDKLGGGGGGSGGGGGDNNIYGGGYGVGRRAAASSSSSSSSSGQWSGARARAHATIDPRRAAAATAASDVSMGFEYVTRYAPAQPHNSSVCVYNGRGTSRAAKRVWVQFKWDAGRLSDEHQQRVIARSALSQRARDRKRSDDADGDVDDDDSDDSDSDTGDSDDTDKRLGWPTSRIADDATMRRTTLAELRSADVVLERVETSLQLSTMSLAEQHDAADACATFVHASSAIEALVLIVIAAAQWQVLRAVEARQTRSPGGDLYKRNF